MCVCTENKCRKAKHFNSWYEIWVKLSVCLHNFEKSSVLTPLHK